MKQNSSWARVHVNENVTVLLLFAGYAELLGTTANWHVSRRKPWLAMHNQDYIA